MTEADFAYLAGLVDGEGHFNPGLGTNCFGIVVSMCDEGAIEFLHKTFGGFRCSGGKTQKGRSIYRWTLQGHDDLRTALEGALPYFRVKIAKAEKTLDLIHHIKTKPEWPTLTARETKPERRRRSAIIKVWRERREEMRRSIRYA